MSWAFPHIFKDGVDEVASGVQVNDNFNTVKGKVEALEGTASGQVYSGILAPPTNEVKQIPGSEIKTPALLPAQILVVWFTAAMEAAGNTVEARLRVNGVEKGFGIATSTNVTFVSTTVERMTGFAGVVTLDATAHATSAVGKAFCQIYYEVRNS